MACFRPLKAYRKPGGGVAFDGVKGYVDRPLDLPCGQCIGCRLARSRDWAVRCVHEAQLHEASCFVTLTYDEDHLPEDGGLVLRHWQLFAKRLRKELGPFRFFHCGEYGEQTYRPHYHALLFGVDFSSDREVYQRHPHFLWRSDTLDRVWGMSQHNPIGAVSYETASYVARYVVKKLTGNEAAETYGDLRPPYVTMSRRPGIGSGWLEKFSSDVYPSDEVVINARRFRPPRFYDKKVGEVDESFLDLIKRKRRDQVSREDATPDRLAVREKVAEATVNFFGRSL